MSLEAVIFDLYGTLVDIWTDEADPFVYQTLSRFLRYYGISFEPDELAARYQESAAAQKMERACLHAEIDVFLVFEEILAEGLKKTPERALVIWLARLFRSLTINTLGLFTDTLPALEMLAPRYRLGVVSDAQWVFSEPEIRFLGLEKFLETVVLSSRYFICKPSPLIYSHALRAMKLEPSQALYVGNDANRDVAGPQAIGMPVALILRQGWPPPPPEVPAIRSLEEIAGLISSHFHD